MDRIYPVMQIEVIQHVLKFRFQAGTSRGVLREKDSYFIKLTDGRDASRIGIGECGPLPGLSPDLDGNLIGAFSELINYGASINHLELKDVELAVPAECPALRFALETALLDWQFGGKRLIFDNGFFHNSMSIPINGLVWMGDKSTMLQRIEEKLDAGYDCIKIKVGAIAHEDELDLLKFIRSRFADTDITIRLDANGAFDERNAMEMLDDFARFHIHSMEQPVMAGNLELIAKVCRDSPIPIALDEELIGIHGSSNKQALLDFIRPAYIVLKPTLHGGCASCADWINIAVKRSIGWWLTSALESNIGLNAIAQFAAGYSVSMPQGLGTGQLFYDNIPSPLQIHQGRLSYSPDNTWDLSLLI
ncbi:MAG: o-succinylbenzoate synthase [Cyclobacteriaceae bacterium]|nr:o-succinylbenzoate synthase [Cyclobacteriaceae bacterium]